MATNPMAERGSVADERKKAKEDEAAADKPEKPEKAERGGGGVLEKGVEKAERAERADRERADAPRAAVEAEPPREPPAEPDVGAPPIEKLEKPDPTPSIPPMPAAGPWRSYKELVASLAGRIVEAQRPIRVLQAIRWDNSVEEQFLRARGRELPKVDVAWYESVDLGFDPRSKAEEFEEIARDIDRDLGETDAIGSIMGRTAIEYRDVVRMLAARGTPGFYAYSRKLYGSPKDKFPDGKSSVRDLGHLLYGILTNVDDESLALEAGPSFERTLTSQECATELNERFARYFSDTTVRVHADDTILADAAAGNDYVKVRTGAKFSPRDVDILEVHEGWVHVASSLNGQAQTVAKWLAKGPPRTVAVQEGLAALLEIFTFRTFPRRARRLNDRVLARTSS